MEHGQAQSALWYPVKDQTLRKRERLCEVYSWEGKGRAGAEEGSQKVKQRMNQQLQECKV